MTDKQVITAIIRDKKGRILSIGRNSYTRTHPLQKKHADKVGEPFKVFMHAEVSAIVRCPDLTKAYSVDIIRVNKEGKHLVAEPCKICRSALSAAGITVINHS